MSAYEATFPGRGGLALWRVVLFPAIPLAFLLDAGLRALGMPVGCPLVILVWMRWVEPPVLRVRLEL